jgi:hypothetical protein
MGYEFTGRRVGFAPSPGFGLMGWFWGDEKEGKPCAAEGGEVGIYDSDGKCQKVDTSKIKDELRQKSIDANKGKPCGSGDYKGILDAEGHCIQIWDDSLEQARREEERKRAETPPPPPPVSEKKSMFSDPVVIVGGIVALGAIVIVMSKKKG